MIQKLRELAYDDLHVDGSDNNNFCTPTGCIHARNVLQMFFNGFKSDDPNATKAEREDEFIRLLMKGHDDRARNTPVFGIPTKFARSGFIAIVEWICTTASDEVYQVGMNILCGNNRMMS